MKYKPSAIQKEMINPLAKGGQMKGHGDRFKEIQKPKSIRKTIKSLWYYLHKERFVLIVIMGLVLIQVFSSLVAPLYIGLWIDHLGEDLSGTVSVDFTILWVITLSYLISGLSQWAQTFLMAGSSQRIVYRVRSDLFSKITHQPISFYDQRSHGDLMSRFMNDVEQVSAAINDTLIHLISAFLTIVGALAMMISIHGLLTVITLSTMPLVFLLTRLITKKTRPLFKKQQKSTGDLNGLIEETLEGIEVVQAFNREEKWIEMYNQVNENLYKSGKSAQLWTGLLMPMMNVINNLTYVIMGLSGGILVLNGALSIGQVTSFITYSRSLLRPINEVASTYSAFMSALAGAERVFEIIELPDEVVNRQGIYLKQTTKGKITFKEVSFSYKPTVEILKAVSFTVEPGKKIALVGPTGAGKTTIASLLAQFYIPSKGHIYIDDDPIEAYNRESVSRGFGIVLQDTYLFEETVMNNIRYGRLRATDAEVVMAAQQAYAHSFITKLPMGYNQMISPGGENLSSGEKQLITIARALLCNPLVLILDEATSNVDTQTEKAVQKAMLELMQNRTSFIIAHRLSTIRDADMILFIQEGRIIEMGTHQELMQLKGLYHRQYIHQYEGYDE